MSFSFQLPEEDPVCECSYDEMTAWIGKTAHSTAT